MSDPGIIRNRLKCTGAFRNARAYLQFKENLGWFSEYLWAFGVATIVRPRITDTGQFVATTGE